MYRIILNDGTTFEDARAGLADGFLWLWIPGITVAEASRFAFDPEKTAEIRFQHGNAEELYEGYTTCRHLMTNPDEVSVCLVRG